jgi:ZIP family zinc transporter
MEVDFHHLLIAFCFTLFAGLSTGIGSAIAFFAKKTDKRFLAVSLGFSAGVMIYVSFVEILSKARIQLSSELGDRRGYWAVVGAFFAGILSIAVIDKLIPERANPHEFKSMPDISAGNDENHKLMRMGLFTALVIAIHNFPEGLATFTAALTNLKVGIAIAVAVAIHNIPEGIAVSVPVYYATGDRKRAFLLSFSSGLAEPLGALLGYLILMPFMSPVVSGVLFGVVAGIMVFISLDELLPSAREYGQHHLSIYGLIAGMGVMALSLLLFV